MTTATNRLRPGRTLMRAAALCLLALAATLVESREARAQWATSGNDINSTNTGNVGVGTPSPDTNAKLHVYNPPSAGVDIQSANSGGWSRLRLMTDTHAYGWFTGDSSQPDAANKIGLYDYTVNAFRMMVDSSGNVGFGASSPASKLHVLDSDTTPDNEVFVETTTGNYGPTVRLKSSIPGQAADFLLSATASSNAGGAGAFRIYDYLANATRLFIAPSTGNMGVGTATPDANAKLHVYNAPNAGVDVQSASGGGWSRLRLMTGTHAYGWFTGDASAADAPNKIGLYDYTVGAFRMMVDSSGNVGVGTNAPAARLDVAGDIRVSGNINAKYQDVAEWVPSKQKLQAGTVVVLDTAELNHVRESAKAYDTGVAGVISAQPGIALGDKGEGKLLVATTGRVKVKVDATRGAIKVGDLLVTSDVAGVAMKSQPLELGGAQIHRPGTIVGKALEPLEKGTGEILVLLSLQ